MTFDKCDVFSSFYPTTVIMVDDNASFLKSVVGVLEVGEFHYKPFDNPHFALAFLSNLYKPKKSEELPTKTFEGEVVAQIYSYIYNFSRFTYISTLLVDYEMPGINGVEFCNLVRVHHEIDTIMLTGVATSALVNKAINNGVISGFLRKNDLTFPKNIAEALRNSQKKFFERETRCLLDLYSSSNNVCGITLDGYANFFNDIIISKNPKCYYLLDNYGSYLLIEPDDKITAVFVWNKFFADSLLKYFTGIYELSTLNPLMTGERIICFPYKTESMQLHDLSIFIRNATRYDESISYVYIDDVSYFIDMKRATLFTEYLEKTAFSDEHFSTLFNL